MAKPESVFIYVGTHPSKTAAEDDYEVVKDLHALGAVGNGVTANHPASFRVG
jgi:hypothetical protein